MPSPSLDIKNLAVIGKENTRARDTERSVRRQRRAEAVKIYMICRRHARAYYYRATIFLQSGIIEYSQVEIFVSIASRFDYRNTFLRCGFDSRKNISPILHGNIFSVRTRRL